MIVFQRDLLVFGIARRVVHRVPAPPTAWDHPCEQVVAFGAGAVAWIGFAMIAISGPVAWTFIGTVVALYLPSLIALIASGNGRLWMPNKMPDRRGTHSPRLRASFAGGQQRITQRVHFRWTTAGDRKRQ